MVRDHSPLGERIFVSADVARIAGISLRQLQWWDEQKLVSPRRENHCRTYSREQVLEMVIVAALRRKGLSLQKMRKVLRLLRRELREQRERVWSAAKLYLLTDGNTIEIEDRPDDVINRITDAARPVYLLSLAEQAGRILSDRPTPRYRVSQLPLFDR
jgi:DNA-binding transcriptional MerR regulator